jgi:hypothetical protein
VGVLVAAALGGVLGMAAFRMTASSDAHPSALTSPAATERPAEGPSAASTTTAATAAAASVSAGGAGTTAGGAAIADARAVTIKITSEPAGASVREDATELCTPTPCDVTFKGDAADPAKTHKLLLTHAGFRPETRVVKTSDSSVHVKLVRAGGGGGGRPAGPAATKPTSTSTDSTPNGFKDLPY